MLSGKLINFVAENSKLINMNKSDYNEIVAMLAVIYKEIDGLSRVVNKTNVHLSASFQTYLDKLREKASEISVK
jgi:hypothetical protein